jgi:M3 family oligoendopeptidase
VSTAHDGELHFASMTAQTPDLAAVTAEYARLAKAWREASTDGNRWEAFERWDRLRRKLQTWQALTRLRYDQDTRDALRKDARETLDRLAPQLTALDTNHKRLLLGSGRADVERKTGPHLFALWEADLSTFAPELEADLTRENQLEAQYTELIARAELQFDGRSLNLARMDPYAQSPDRDTRYRALRTKWTFFAEHQNELDTIFDEMVRLRDRMAKKLGFENFIEMAYRRMNRTDYGQRDVERYRDQIARDIVPVAAEVIARRGKRLGIPKMMYWDEGMFSSAGNPKPQGDDAWIIAQAQGVFDAVDPEVGAFYAMMVRRGLLDLATRDGKASGGYCTGLTDYDVPFIFANFNGTHGDVNVLVHEMGHALADWEGRALPALDYLSATAETAEIHSMTMEYLTAPHMDRFFGDDAERYRRLHLEDAMLFLPYGVAIDHFQHLVYANPSASPLERHKMWQQMEAKYLHWRRYGDLPHLSTGGLWQAKPHIYQTPFYYIDYTLALCCALQFWSKARADYRGAVLEYLALCRRGGQAAFGELVRGAGLRSPFEDGSLRGVAQQVRGALAG